MAGFGLINMNGRLYDPYLQRFLSPDNVVQDPLNAQSYNRYSYCLNNPLMYTDPSGWQMAPIDQFWNLGKAHTNQTGFNGCYGYVSNRESGVNGPGEGGNGTGLNGVYWDYLSQSYRSVGFEEQVSGPVLNESDFVSDLSYRGKEAQDFINGTYTMSFAHPVVKINTSSLLAKPMSGQKVQGLVAGFEFNFIFVSVSIGVVRLVDDNETRGLSFSVQDGPGFNLSVNVFTGVIWSKKDLNYKDLEGKGVSYEAGYEFKGIGLGGSYGSDSPTRPSYNIITGSFGFGYTKKTGNLMETNTTIILINAINCEHCY